MGKPTIGEKFITPRGRILYPKVFETDTTGQFKDNKYKLQICFDKSDRAVMEQVKLARAACLKLAGQVWPTLSPEQLKDVALPFHDGDKKGKEGYGGTVYITAKSKFRPGVVDKNVKEILDPGEVYSGMWGKCSVTPFTYELPKKGVSYFLGNLQKLSDGDRIGGGGSDPAEDFTAEGGSETEPFVDDDDIVF